MLWNAMENMAGSGGLGQHPCYEVVAPSSFLLNSSLMMSAQSNGAPSTLLSCK